jgi:hypothetical protein
MYAFVLWPMHSICAAHLIPRDLIILIILLKQDKNVYLLHGFVSGASHSSAGININLLSEAPRILLFDLQWFKRSFSVTAMKTSSELMKGNRFLVFFLPLNTVMMSALLSLKRHSLVWELQTHNFALGHWSCLSLSLSLTNTHTHINTNTHTHYLFIMHLLYLRVEVTPSLSYKPEGRGFETQWGEFFQFT